jgi:hypothetical protein
MLPARTRGGGFCYARPSPSCMIIGIGFTGSLDIGPRKFYDEP